MQGVPERSGSSGDSVSISVCLKLPSKDGVRTGSGSRYWIIEVARVPADVSKQQEARPAGLEEADVCLADAVQQNLSEAAGNMPARFPHMGSA